jgi:hypothetical protein
MLKKDYGIQQVINEYYLIFLTYSRLNFANKAKFKMNRLNGIDYKLIS